MQVNLTEVEAEIKKACEIATKNFMSDVKSAIENGSYNEVKPEEHSFTNEFIECIFDSGGELFDERITDDIPF